MIKTSVKFWMFGLLSVVAVGGPSRAPAAEALDAASQEALQKTLTLLSNPEARDKAAHENAAARDADSRAQQIAGSAANKDTLYEVAGRVMEDLVRATGGDSEKMMQIIAQAQSNPQVLASKLSPATLAAITAASQQLGAEKKKPHP